MDTQIIYICQDGINPSGIATYGYSLLEAFPSARMLLLNAEAPPRAAPEKVIAQIFPIPEHLSHNPESVRKALARLIENSPAKVVIFPNTGFVPWKAVSDLAEVFKYPKHRRLHVLGYIHSDMESQYSGAVNYGGMADAWIGVSQACARELKARFANLGIERTVINLPYPMRIPSEVSSPNTTAPLRLIYSGRLEEPQKRVSRLSELFSKLTYAHISFRALIAGDGPAAHTLKSLISSSPAAGNVLFTGSLDQSKLRTLYADSDIFLLCSYFEGLPLSLLEAMAGRVCPVVMKMRSGIEETVIDGRNGRTVDQGSITGMVQAIAELDRNRVLLEQLKTQARETIASQFAPLAHFSELTALLDKLDSSPQRASIEIADPEGQAIVEMIHLVPEKSDSIFVYGSGMFGRRLIDACLERNMRVSGMIDSDPSRQKEIYRGIPCHPPSEISQFSDATFLVGSMAFSAEITHIIKETFAKRGGTLPIIITPRNASSTGPIQGTFPQSTFSHSKQL